MHVPKALDVVTLGEAMALFVAEQAGPLEAVQNFKRMTAGAELNVAVGLSRLGFRVGYVSRVGADSFGKFLLNFLDAEKIDRSHVTVDRDHPTGFMLKSLADVGSDPIIEYHRKGSAASCLALHNNPADYFALSKHLHLTGIAPALSKPTLELTFQMAVEARSQGRSVSFDPNLRPRLWSSQKHMVETINRLAQQADLVLPGLAEGELLSGETGPARVADFFLDLGAQQVVIKLGAKGAYFADSHNRGTVRGLKVPQVVDTVGAGDGFAVGVISALLEGQSLEQATRRGNSIGARVVQFPGDCDGLPDRLTQGADFQQI
jgi:2-dehydro-3-deoxygluconokinase